MLLIIINRSDSNADSSPAVNEHLFEGKPYVFISQLLSLSKNFSNFHLLRFVTLSTFDMNLFFILVLSVKVCSFLNCLYQIFPYW